MRLDQKLLDSVKDISRQAGTAILEVYERAGEIQVDHKEDDSPLTEADLAAHNIIVEGLESLSSEIPVLSEESKQISWETRKAWSRYWLVDPLDGTKEFINRNGEFTVNIALIENNAPVLGVVYVPVTNVLYSGATSLGAFKEINAVTKPIQVAPTSVDRLVRVVASRRHRGEELEHWLQKVDRLFKDLELVSMGSSLKICLVAEGEADIYPRLALTSEWDTAAAQAILEAAGGVLTDAEFHPYRYNLKENILNPYFFAIGDPGFNWKDI